MTPVHESCSNCRFWDAALSSDPDGDGDRASCRRYPPMVVRSDFGVHPLTGPGDWCGEWQLDPEAEG
jgi:hypothetical protein